MGVLVIASLSSRLWRTVMDMGLRKKVAVLFIGMLVVAALNLGLLHRMLQDFNGVAATATVAGKLRMLGQKLAFETLSISNGLSKAYETLEHDIIDFEAAYLVLRSGGTAFNEFVRPLDEPAQSMASTLRRSSALCSGVCSWRRAMRSLPLRSNT